jgi:hypothetical protein
MVATMDDTKEPEPALASKPDVEVQYYLKELEFQFEIETKARDRVENMVQYLLTSFAAIIGAVLLVNEMQGNLLLLLFIATLLVFTVSISAFYRMCRLRYIITYARVTRNHLRGMMEDLGVRKAGQLIRFEGNPSGFSERMTINLKVVLALCSLLGGAAGVFGLLLIFRETGWLAAQAGFQRVVVILAPAAVTALVAGTLWAILHNLKRKAEKLITEADWRKLPDREL